MNEGVIRMWNRKLHAILGILVCCAILFSTDQGRADENYFLNVAPLGWDYGNVLVGTSATATFDLESLGPSAVWIYYPFLNETQDEVPPLAIPINPYFEYTLGAFSFDPLTLPIFPRESPEGEHNLIDVIFAPPSPGYYTVYLGIVSNDYDVPGPQAFFLLEGTGVGTPVPEPATMLLLASGLVGLVGVRRKFKR